jgi:hypothetical protein
VVSRQGFFAGIVGFGVALAAVVAVSGTVARAEDPTSPPPMWPTRQVCRLFPVDLPKDRDIDTASRTTEVGQWLADRQKEGLDLYTMDFETAQKETGYPVGWVQVCVVPR